MCLILFFVLLEFDVITLEEDLFFIQSGSENAKIMSLLKVSGFKHYRGHNDFFPPISTSYNFSTVTARCL